MAKAVLVSPSEATAFFIVDALGERPEISIGITLIVFSGGDMGRRVLAERFGLRAVIDATTLGGSGDVLHYDSTFRHHRS